MRIHPQALERLRAAAMSGATVASTLERLVAALDAFPEAHVGLNLDYQQAADEEADGDLIPVVTISLRPATLRTT